jgi:hypothetical protein
MRIEIIESKDIVVADLKALLAEEATQPWDTGDLATAFLELSEYSLDEEIDIVTRAEELAKLYLKSLAYPYDQYLSKLIDQSTLFSLDREIAYQILLDNLLTSTSGEPTIFDEQNAAENFLTRVFTWLGEGCLFLTNMQRKIFSREGSGRIRFWSGRSGFTIFEVNNCLDEGIIFISKSKIGLLWFLGYD